MKRTWSILFICLSCCGCILFRSRVDPYPTGVIFPVIQSQEISFEGEPSELLHRVNDSLVFATNQGMVSAYNGLSQELLWRFQTDAPGSTPLIRGREGFYIVDQQNTVYSLSLEGKLLWKSLLPEAVTGGICEDEIQLYMGSESGRFFALDRSQGEIRWDFKAGGAIHSFPVCTQGKVLFGCDDFNLYCLSQKGMSLGRFSASDRIRGRLLADNGWLYFGADDYYIYCLNLENLTERWKVKTGGMIRAAPVTDARHVFTVSMNNVLTCLSKKNGHIRWWKNLPARTNFRPEIVQDRIIVATRSRRIVCYETTTGNLRGEYTARAVLRSNPVWFAPHLLVAIQDPSTDLGVLQFLDKHVSANLTASKASPQEINEEIVVTANLSGFYLPQYEFYLTRHLLLRYGFEGLIWVRTGEEKLPVQEESEKGTWNWYPDQEGAYLIEVQVKDEKESASAKTPFLIKSKPPEPQARTSLTTSKASPQEINAEVLVSARATGFDLPRYEFYLTRHLPWRYGFAGFIWVRMEEEQRVQEESEKGTWSWSPDQEGVYLIEVRVKDEKESASAKIYFVIEKKPEDIIK